MHYIIRILKGASLSKCSRAVDLVQKRSGQGRLHTVLDMLTCTMRYGAGYHDYALFGFEFLTSAQRDTYVTRMRNKKILDRMNQKEYVEEFNDKVRFLSRFARFLVRDFLILPAEPPVLAQFLKKHPLFFAKPSRGCGGKGICVLNQEDFPDQSALIRFLSERQLSILEAPISQHPRMAALHPASVNTLRIVTDFVEGQAHIAYVLLKIGRGDAVCDNSGQGGMFCRVALHTGCVCSVAVDDEMQIYERHPDTNAVFLGYPIPFFSDALALAKKAAAVLPQIGHIGWDIAITTRGAVIVEGNADPGVMCQFYPQWEEKEGLYPYYQRLLKL